MKSRFSDCWMQSSRGKKSKKITKVRKTMLFLPTTFNQKSIFVRKSFIWLSSIWEYFIWLELNFVMKKNLKSVNNGIQKTVDEDPWKHTNCWHKNRLKHLLIVQIIVINSWWRTRQTKEIISFKVSLTLYLKHYFRVVFYNQHQVT